MAGVSTIKNDYLDAFAWVVLPSLDGMTVNMNKTDREWVATLDGYVTNFVI